MERTALKYFFCIVPLCHKFHPYKCHILMSCCTHNFVETPSVARNNTVSPVSTLWARWSSIWFLVGIRGLFPSAKRPEHHCSPHCLLVKWLARVLCPWTGHPTCEAANHLHLVLRLIYSWSIPLFPPYTSTVWAGTILPLLGCQLSTFQHQHN